MGRMRPKPIVNFLYQAHRVYYPFPVSRTLIRSKSHPLSPMEKAWPPLSECFQFKIGIMNHALRRYPWEDDKYEFDFNSYYPPIPDELASLRKLLDYLNKIEFRRTFPEDIRNCPFCRLHPDPPAADTPTGRGYTSFSARTTIPLSVDILKDPVWDMDPIPCPIHLYQHLNKIWTWTPRLVTPIELENTKKYLNQVRNSRGYDVDCAPNAALVDREFWDFDLNNKVGRDMKDSMKGRLNASAIVHINKKTGKVYQLEDILKIVTSQRFLLLVTFTAKVKNDPNDCETFIATIGVYDNVLRECLLKPGCDAPGPDHYPDFITQPIQVPSFCMKRPAALPGEHDPMLSKAKRNRTMTEAVTSQEVLRPPLEDSQCKGWLKACSRAAPMADLDPKAAEEHPMRFSGKQHPSASTAEKMLTIVSNMAKLNEEVEKLKSLARSLSMDFESLCKDFSPLDPSIFPLQSVEVEPLQTLPPDVEQNRDKGGGSSFHVVETSPNPEAEDIPLI